MLIKYFVYITLGKNNPGQVNVCVCISTSIHSNAHTTTVRIYGEPYAHKFCAVDIFWNISRRLAISPVAKFCHVLGRGLMTQRVILIFIKCLSGQSESTILHESIIIFDYFDLLWNKKTRKLFTTLKTFEH